VVHAAQFEPAFEGQRVRLTGGAVAGEHELRVHMLAQRFRPGEPLQLATTCRRPR
jgi:hypothetical protein